MAFTSLIVFMGIGIGCLRHLQRLYYLWSVWVDVWGVHSVCSVSETFRLVFYLFIFLVAWPVAFTVHWGGTLWHSQHL